VKPHQGEKFAAQTGSLLRRRSRIAQAPVLIIEHDRQAALVPRHAHSIAVAQARERPAAKRLRRHMYRRRHFAGCARHPSVGDQRNPEAAILDHALGRHELVQFGHAVCAGTLKPDDDNDIAIEFAGLESTNHIGLHVQTDGALNRSPEEPPVPNWNKARRSVFESALEPACQKKCGQLSIACLMTFWNGPVSPDRSNEPQKMAGRCRPISRAQSRAIS
jgi:hypothetical protein